MSSPNNKEEELRRREKEIQDREYALRLRELEAEINQSPVYQTQKHRPTEKPLAQSNRPLVKVAKFLAIFVAVIVSVKIAAWLTSVLMVGCIAWVAYKLFLESERR